MIQIVFVRDLRNILKKENADWCEISALKQKTVICRTKNGYVRQRAKAVAIIKAVLPCGCVTGSGPSLKHALQDFKRNLRVKKVLFTA